MTRSIPAAPRPGSSVAVFPTDPFLRRWLGALVLVIGVCLFAAERPIALALGSVLGLWAAIVLMRPVPSDTKRAFMLREGVLTAFAVVIISALAVFTLAYLRSPTPPHPEERRAALVALRAIFVAGCVFILLRTWWQRSLNPPHGAA
jgi:hypothetical protein